MGFLSAKSPEEQAAKAAKLQAQHLKTPGGQAKAAYERGDRVFQFLMTVSGEQKAYILIYTRGDLTSRTETDASADLNAIVDEGWELMTGSITFVQTGEESRDKFLAFGQQVAVKGQVMAC